MTNLQIETLAEIIDRPIPIYRGMHQRQIFLALSFGLLLGGMTGIGLGLTLTWMLLPAMIVAGPVLSVRFSGAWLEVFQRGKPHMWLERSLAAKLAEYGILNDLLVGYHQCSLRTTSLAPNSNWLE